MKEISTQRAQVGILEQAWESKLVIFETDAEIMWPAQLTSFDVFTALPPRSAMITRTPAADPGDLTL